MSAREHFRLDAKPDLSPIEPKPCMQCGTVFGPTKTEGRKHWQARKYCSRACTSESQRVYGAFHPATKECQHCGKLFWPPPWLQSRPRWKEMKFCSRSCGGKGANR